MPGGSIGTRRADDFVTQRFLDRWRFAIQGRDVASFRDGERAWVRTSIQERRSLLSLAIQRIVLVPWPGGDKPLRSPRRRRELRIEWAPATKTEDRLVILGEASPVQPHRPRVSEGRAEMMRALEVTAGQRRREKRSERSKTSQNGEGSIANGHSTGTKANAGQCLLLGSATGSKPRRS